MRLADITKALRRDDMAIHGNCFFDELDCVFEPDNGSGSDEPCVLLVDSDVHGCVQVIEQMDDIDNEGDAVFVYVPLAFGPVQEQS